MPVCQAALPLAARYLPGGRSPAGEFDPHMLPGKGTEHIKRLEAGWRQKASNGRAITAEPEPDSAVSVPAAAFVSTALKVAGSASRDETRPVLTGILVSASERELRMVATDSYRLSIKETALESSLSAAFEVNAGKQFCVR